MAADGPTVSRRREVGHASARSLLTTLLGEYVLPRDQPTWTSTLVGALGRLGVEEKSARQALARTAAEGWLVSERFGRRVRWSLTPPDRRLLTEGAQRIYEFGSRAREWDGRWLVLLVAVPESTRDLRHRLRTQLIWAGFGSPAAGVWVCPDVAREDEAHRIVTGLRIAEPMSFTATYGTIGEEAAMVARSWDLRVVQDRYAAFVDEFADLAPATTAAAMAAQTRLVHEWRRFPFLDPRLPSRLLPETWSGAVAAELFHSRHQTWRAAAQRHWDELP